MGGSKLETLPADNEIEVSLFGPGYGESILVHLGNKEWMVVDSCLTKSKAPAATEYLRSLGVDPAEAVRMVVATHWHDDHIRGLSSILEQCKNAKFVCSDALRSDEFIELAFSHKERSMMTSSGVREFGEVMRILEERVDKKSRFPSPSWASADRKIWASGTTGSATIQSEVHSLSPSDASITLSKHAIASLIPRPLDKKKRVTSRPPNHVAVALWVKVGTSGILLGSDLENTPDPSTGWVAILDSVTRPQGKASVFKIAHHGSITAHEPRVWEELLQVQPHAALTPFIHGSTALPTKTDVARIIKSSAQSYSTATTKTKEPKTRHSIVSKTIRETVRSIKEVPSSTGVVRFRKLATDTADASWKIDLFGTAVPLKSVCA
ncbi:MAG: MBL fold metallo-hydrolase [Nitrospira sp.]